MSVGTALTDQFDRALLYATHVHGGQVRNATTIPYVAHLLAVAATVLEYGGSGENANARLPPDAGGNQGGEARLARTRQPFWERLAGILGSCSHSAGKNPGRTPK